MIQPVAGSVFTTVEHRPADLVAQALVVQYEVAYLGWQPIPLPLALVTTRRFPGGSANGLDRVGGGSEFVRGDVGNGAGLSGGIGGVSGSPAEFPCSTHGVAPGRAGLHHSGLAAHPRASLSDRFPWPLVVGSNRFKEIENVFGTRGRPQREEVVVFLREGAAPANCDETRIADLGQNHR